MDRETNVQGRHVKSFTNMVTVFQEAMDVIFDTYIKSKPEKVETVFYLGNLSVLDCCNKYRGLSSEQLPSLKKKHIDAHNIPFWFLLSNYANKLHAEKGLRLVDNQRQCFFLDKKV